MNTFTSAWVGRKEQVEFRQEKVREAGPGEVRVRIKACGVCGTDIHFFKEFPDEQQVPLGHEVAGIIESTGPGVRTVGVGTAVVIQNHIPCGVCDACLNQRPDACKNIRTYMDEQAGMAEYLVVPAAMAIAFEGLDFASATLAEPVTVALDLCREASIRMDDTVLIMGPGTIGLSCVPIVKRQGASLVVVAGHGSSSIRGAHRKAVAASLGADAFVDTADSGWKEKLLASYPGGFDRVIVTSPPNTIADGIKLAGFRSSIVFDGISYQDDSITFGANDFHFQKKRLIASHAIPNWGFPQALGLLKEGTIDPKLLLTHRYPFDQLEQALRDYGSPDLEIIKVAVEI
jgi:threonine dehydrogenase-like Zn-dependent dehydrogenase